MNDDALITAATDARKKAYAPYSGFKVGAALLDENGRIHTGQNVENAAYPNGICAETAAIAMMVQQGEQRSSKLPFPVVMEASCAPPAVVADSASGNLPRT